MGGLHRFMSWPNAILTDSGGFQVFSLSGLRKITDEGVVFRSHLNGDLHTFTPESTVDVQLAFGSDILMALDECPEYPVSHEYARESMQRTVRWARQAGRALPAAHGAKAPRGTRCSPSCRGPCSRTCGASAPPRWSIWSATATPSAASRWASRARSAWRWWKPPRTFCRAPGRATPWAWACPPNLPEYVARGVDMMDCVLPSRNARNGCLFTSQGRVIIKHARYKDDQRPLDRALQLLYLYPILPRVPSPSVPFRGDPVCGAGDAAQHSPVP